MGMPSTEQSGAFGCKTTASPLYSTTQCSLEEGHHQHHHDHHHHHRRRHHHRRHHHHHRHPPPRHHRRRRHHHRHYHHRHHPHHHCWSIVSSVMISETPTHLSIPLPLSAMSGLDVSVAIPITVLPVNNETFRITHWSRYSDRAEFAPFKRGKCQCWAKR